MKHANNDPITILPLIPLLQNKRSHRHIPDRIVESKAEIAKHVIVVVNFRWSLALVLLNARLDIF